MMKKFLLLGFALILAGCASGNYKPTYIVSEIEVINNSRETIRQVTVSVQGTDTTIDCGDIAPLGVCTNHIGKRRYDHNPIEVDWVFGNTAAQTEEFMIDVPAYFSTGVPLGVELAFSPEGELTASADQDTPLR